MFEYLEISLDVATALSFIGAAVTFLIQTQRQKRVDLESEQWSLYKELTDEFVQYR